MFIYEFAHYAALVCNFFFSYPVFQTIIQSYSLSLSVVNWTNNYIFIRYVRYFLCLIVLVIVVGSDVGWKWTSRPRTKKIVPQINIFVQIEIYDYY